MYDNLFSNAKLTKKLEDLAQVLVPESFRSEAPQYYEMIKAFLANVQVVQESAGNNFLDLIDVDRITSNDILHLYFDTYLATLNIDATFDVTNAKDILKVSKDLSVRKGTPFIYGILINLLVFLFEDITNQYKELIDLVESGDLSEDEKAAILDEISLLREVGLTSSFVEVTEDPVDPFKYSVSADFSKDAFEKYVKPFCHPAGWKLTFFQTVIRLMKESIESYESFELYQTFYLPTVNSNEGVVANQDDFLPLIPFLDLYSLGTDLTTLQKKMKTPSRLYVAGGQVYYDFIKVSPMKWYTNRPIQTVTEDGVLKYDIRYNDSSIQFPGSLYTANMIYYSNNPAVKANCGFFGGYYGKLISYNHQLEYDQVV